MIYRNNAEKSGWKYNFKSAREIVEKNDYIKNIRKKLVNKKIKKSLSKYKKE